MNAKGDRRGRPAPTIPAKRSSRHPRFDGGRGASVVARIELELALATATRIEVARALVLHERALELLALVESAFRDELADAKRDAEAAETDA
ncbi:MAG TPA: hypothetical protein VIL77_04075 [Gaiellaceae bacterium]